jgi:transposase
MARAFTTTARTVRKWLRRYQLHGPSGLVEQSRARHHQSQKTPPAVKAQLVQLRKTLPTFEGRRLIGEFDLPISHRASERIWQAHGLIQKRRQASHRSRQRRLCRSHPAMPGSLRHLAARSGPANWQRQRVHRGP